MYGITLSNLSYDDINISKLYIKYDKNLIVKSDNLVYFDKKTNKSLKFEINTTVNYKKDNLILDIKKLKYLNNNLQLKAKVYLTQEKIDQLINNDDKNITLYNVEFIFDKKLKPLKSKEVYLNYKKDDIFLKFKSPSYNSIKLNGTNVKIQNIKKNTKLLLNIHTNNIFDKKVKNILHYYGVDLPIKQYSGTNNVYAKLNIDLNSFNTDVKIDAKIKNSKISYEDKIIKSKNLIVSYKNKILDINIKTGNISYDNILVDFDKLKLKLKDEIIDINTNSGYIIYDKDKVKYTNIKANIKNELISSNIQKLYLKEYDISLNNNKILFNQKTNKVSLKSNIVASDAKVTIDSKYDINKNKSEGYVKIDSFIKEDLFAIRNNEFKYEYEKSADIINFRIDKYALFYTKYGKEKHIIQINKFSPLLREIKFLKNVSNNSNIRIQTTNNFKSTNIYLSKAEFDIDDKKFDKYNNQKSKYTYLPKIDMDIYKSKIAYDGRYIYIKSAKVNIIDNKTSIHIIPLNDSGKIDINVIGKHIKVDARNLSSKFLNRVMKENRFKGGTMDLYINATPRDVNGKVNFHKITVRNVRVVNNLIAFINTTPAYFNPILALPTLFHLGETNFSTNGYLIKEGNANFSYNIKSKILKITSIYTKGVMADFKGSLTANFAKNKLKSKVKVIFLKDYSRVINKIPVLGYIIVGKDGNFETQVDIDGTFEKQTFQTHLLKNTTGGILNMIKRTISIPLLPFVKDKEK
jgi:hypothetical protein